MNHVINSTCERPVPHSPGDLGSVGRIEPVGDCFVDGQRVENDGVVERTDETVDLHR